MNKFDERFFTFQTERRRLIHELEDLPKGKAVRLYVKAHRKELKFYGVEVSLEDRYPDLVYMTPVYLWFILGFISGCLLFPILAIISCFVK